MEDTSTPPPKRPRRHSTDVNNDLEMNVLALLPDEMMVNILGNYLDVRTLVEIKLVSHQFQHLSTTAIDAKGIATKQRKAFETNDELRTAVKRYCPPPARQSRIHDDIFGNTTMKFEYCDREIAEDIACMYGWPINKWNVSDIEDFSGIFRGSECIRNRETGRREFPDGIVFFNEDISLWNVSKATTMNSMFSGTVKFNHNLSTWDVSNVTDMDEMFCKAIQFNQDISIWNVSKVTTMIKMFSATKQFNQDLSTWDVSSVTSMDHMFSDANEFNQDLSTWDVSNVTNMKGMFSNTRQFNQNLSTWNVSNVTNMTSMFGFAGKFNQNLSNWDVSNVTEMRMMFWNAQQFKQNISSWDGWDLDKQRLYYEDDDNYGDY